MYKFLRWIKLFFLLFLLIQLIATLVTFHFNLLMPNEWCWLKQDQLKDLSFWMFVTLPGEIYLLFILWNDCN